MKLFQSCVFALTAAVSSLSLISAETGISPDGIHVVLGGDHADPTLVRDGADYYLTYSSYTKYPGLKIWHSTNLVDWEPIGYALHDYVGAVWAPELIKQGDQFVIYFPTSRGENYVVTASNPAGPWSGPVKLEVSGIDPGHITDEAGNRFIYLNGGKFAELSADGLTVTRDAVKKYDGWPIPESWEIECFCLESPKLSKRDGYYYLTSAQGGTAGPATSHMVVSARAKSPEGPWEESPHNPIVHTWSADEQFWSKGHGTIFDDPEGHSYVIYHAYQKGRLAFGRHVLIERIQWTEDGWFHTVRDRHTEGPIHWHANERVTHDTFADEELAAQWQFTGLAEPFDSYRVKDEALELEASPDTWRTVHVNPDEKDFEVQVEVAGESGDPGPSGRDLVVGLGVYYNEEHFVGIGVQAGLLASLRDGKTHLVRDAAEGVRFLKIRFRGQVVSMFSSGDGQTWTKFGRAFEMSGYQHNSLGGFSYVRPAVLYRGTGKARVRNFTYTPLSTMN